MQNSLLLTGPIEGAEHAGRPTPPGNLDPDEWRFLVDLVRLIKRFLSAWR
jgi:hypothetical protein